MRDVWTGVKLRDHVEFMHFIPLSTISYIICTNSSSRSHDKTKVPVFGAHAVLAHFIVEMVVFKFSHCCMNKTAFYSKILCMYIYQRFWFHAFFGAFRFCFLCTRAFADPLCSFLSSSCTCIFPLSLLDEGVPFHRIIPGFMVRARLLNNAATY